MWVAKLTDYVTNELLQGCDIDTDSGCFNPFPTHVEFDDSVDNWEVKSFCLYVHWELTILDVYRNIDQGKVENEAKLCSMRPSLRSLQVRQHVFCYLCVLTEGSS